MTTEPPLHLHVGGATHFLTWERPVYASRFRLVAAPQPDAHLHAFGPDVLESGAALPASSRSIYLFPGFVPRSPFFDDEVRRHWEDVLRSAYDLVFVNPGPMAALFGHLPQARVVPFSVDVGLVPFRERTAVRSLLHASADYPQKDWPRSEATMAATGLPYEVFPPRDETIKHHWSRSRLARLRANRVLRTLRVPWRLRTTPGRYVPHSATIERYLAHDGFVHVAAPVAPALDGLYTATLIEAGLSGAITFWHDTHGLGGFLETVVEVPGEPGPAATAVLQAIEDMDVAERSRATRDEMLRTFAPEHAVTRRTAAIAQL